MSETDGLDEPFIQAGRIAMTSAARIGEALMRVRQEFQRRAAEASQERARELAQRLHAEQALARASYARVYEADWWKQSDPSGVAAAYQHAVAWSDLDPTAARAREHIETEANARYGVDLREVDARQAGPTLQEAERTLRSKAEHDGAAAARELAAAEVADRSAATHAERVAEAGTEQEADVHADRAVEASQDADVSRSSAEVSWDSAERRQAEAESLRNRNVSPRAVEAKMLEDTAQKYPPGTTGKGAKRPTKARPARGKAQSQQRQRTRGMSR